MKIKINYDLLSKVYDAKKGFSLVRIAKKTLVCGTIAGIVVTPTLIANLHVPLEETTKGIATGYITNGIYNIITEITLSERNKALAIKELKRLSQTLRDININTNHELLQRAYQYGKTYEFNPDKSFPPQIEQRKYIMVPIYEAGEEKEISLVQEHIVGTNEYSLSIGSPKRVLKPVLKYA